MVYALILEEDYNGADAQVTVVRLANDLATLRGINSFNPAQMGGGVSRDGWQWIEAHPLRNDAGPASPLLTPASIYGRDNGQ